MTPRSHEWLEADGFGGFASHTTDLRRTRRYHALLNVARHPPTDRRVLVNGVEAVVDLEGERFGLEAHTYAGPAESEAPVTTRDGRHPATSFQSEPWPTWTHDLGGGVSVEQSVLVPRGEAAVILSWRLKGRTDVSATLTVRPFLSGRDYHALHRENDAFNFLVDAHPSTGRFGFHPYASEPAFVAVTNGRFVPESLWYRSFLYAEEIERGLDGIEDLASAGTFTFDLRQGEALLALGTHPATNSLDVANLAREVAARREREKARREAAASPLERAVPAYVVTRDEGRTILAGYPWFTDWGRDTFISMRGLCLATGRLREARLILLQWSRAVSQGMLPNRFTDRGEAPDFNSVDASLWFIVAVHELRRAENRAGLSVSTVEEWQLGAAVLAILSAYASGTRHGIRMDDDFLLAAGESGVQLTWMDAKVGDHVVTPRIGKPVEVQALWINALRIGGSLDSRFATFAEQAAASFARRFWNPESGYLYDVVDADHVAGRVDARIRPNALFAVGGLPDAVLSGDHARAVVDLAESQLVTPAGVRTLAPDDPQYRGLYKGGVWLRDTAYHQGTAWPYLMGAFVEAWVRVRGHTADAKREARDRFLSPLLSTLDPEGSGHLPEIADGDWPHSPRGCPFQAWSLGEVLRLEREVLRL